MHFIFANDPSASADGRTQQRVGHPKKIWNLLLYPEPESFQMFMLSLHDVHVLAFIGVIHCITCMYDICGGIRENAPFFTK